VDATLLAAPLYFRLEQAGYHSLANIADYDDIQTATVYLYLKSTVAANPQLPERIIRSHSEAIKRFYEDKEFALKAFLKYDAQNPVDLSRVYDHYKMIEVFERVPYVSDAAVKYILESQYDRRLGDQMSRFDFRTVIDNARIDRMVRDEFFESVFGPGIRAEQDKKRSLAFR